MANHEQPFKERCINHAEKIADNYFKKFDDVYYLKIGFDHVNRIPSKSWFKFPVFLRCMPDSIVVWKGKFYFIEVKGCHDSLKIKESDLEQYKKWNEIADLKYFIFSSKTQSIYLIDHNNLKNFKKVKIGHYKDNNKKYYEIDIEYLSEYKKD